jgi:hypothetical protein
MPQRPHVSFWRISLKKCSRPAVRCDSLELWRQGDSAMMGEGEPFLLKIAKREEDNRQGKLF